jgi:tetratricopeptide (TPR) repeat protein
MSVNPEFIERYQLEYEKNPQSKVFAPLGEAYRKMGLLEQANQICKRGVRIHPDFAGGRVAYAKVLLDMKQLTEALTQLEKAVDISPDNLLAHTLLGETLLELRRPKEALKAFKMVLFLNPDDERARQAVRKWEFLTADEYDEEVFRMQPLFAKQNSQAQEPSLPQKPKLPPSPATVKPATELAPPPSIPPDLARAVERAVSLADAFTVRNDLEAALEVLVQARQALGPVHDIDSRRILIAKRLRSLNETDPEEEEQITRTYVAELSPQEHRRRRDILDDLLQRINIHRHEY